MPRELVAGDEAAGAVLGAEIAIEVQDRPGVEAGEHRAGERAVDAHRHAAHHQAARAELLDGAELRRTALEDAGEAQLGSDARQRLPEELRRADPEQPLEGGVHLGDPLLLVDGDHRLVDVVDDRLELLAADPLRPRGLRHLDGALDGLAHALGGVEQHRSETGPLGHVAGRARPDHHLVAAGGQLGHGGLRLLRGGVGALLDLHAAQEVLPALEARQDAAVVHDPDAVGEGARVRERLQRVGGGDVHQRQRHLGVVAEVGAVGAGRHQRVHALARGGETPHRLERALEAPVEHPHLGAAGEARGGALHHLPQPADAERPDHRLALAAKRHACLRRLSAPAAVRWRCTGSGTRCAE